MRQTTDEPRADRVADHRHNDRDDLGLLFDHLYGGIGIDEGGAVVVNSTIVDNIGGGIGSYEGALTVTNSTITGNTFSHGSIGIGLFTATVVTAPDIGAW